MYFPVPTITHEDVANVLQEYRKRNPQVRGIPVEDSGNIAFEICIADCGETRVEAHLKPMGSGASGLIDELMHGTVRRAHAFFGSLEEACLALQEDSVEWVLSDELT